MANGNRGLAKRVEEFRLSRQFTQAQAAAFLQVSPATYVRVESGKSCSKLTRAKIEKILNQSLQAA